MNSQNALKYTSQLSVKLPTDDFSDEIADYITKLTIEHNEEEKVMSEFNKPPLDYKLIKLQPASPSDYKLTPAIQPKYTSSPRLMKEFEAQDDWVSTIATRKLTSTYERLKKQNANSRLRNSTITSLEDTLPCAINLSTPDFDTGIDFRQTPSIDNNYYSFRNSENQ